MDENECEVDGVRYFAKGMSLDHGCEGCIAEVNDGLCNKIRYAGGPCGNDVRQDQREVIWTDGKNRSPEVFDALLEALEKIIKADDLQELSSDEISFGRRAIAKAYGKT